MNERMRYVEACNALAASLENSLRSLEGRIGRPVPFELAPGKVVLRFRTTDLHHALVLKLALALSNLNAAQILLRTGHVAEQAAINRIAHEATEDIWFLAMAYIEGSVDDLHRRFLEAFWAEEFGDFNDVMGSHKSREMIPRQKIQAWISNRGDDPSSANKAAKIVTKLASGYVHGAAPHLMDLYDPAIPGLSVHGVPWRIGDHDNDQWNYFYRVGLAFLLTAKAFGWPELAEEVQAAVRAFQQATGRDY
jgi:hypothetical protein